jgi:hypothetical protein
VDIPLQDFPPATYILSIHTLKGRVSERIVKY